jgi:hypothetical protein
MATKTSPRRTRPHAVQVRFSEREYAALQAAAGASFLSVGSFVRRHLLMQMLAGGSEPA